MVDSKVCRMRQIISKLPVLHTVLGVLLTITRPAWYNSIMNNYTYTLHIDRAEEGGFVAFFPALPGCHTQGESVEEVIAMAKDALAGYLECLRANGDPIPKEEPQLQPTSFNVPLSMSIA